MGIEMKFAHYQSTISPHVIHLIQGVVDRLGEEHVRYIYESKGDEKRVKLGWSYEEKNWTLNLKDYPDEALDWLENCPRLMCGVRDLNLFERRVKRGLTTIYSSERWFKPICICNGRISIPGWVRLFHPSYFRMVCRFVTLLKSYPDFYYFPVGVHAAREAVWMINLMSGRIWQSFRNRMPNVERRPYGRISQFPNLRMTSYTVASAETPRDLQCDSHAEGPLKVLWIGRMLEWKRVDALILAVRLICKQDPRFEISVKIVGRGPLEQKLKRMSKGLPIEILPSVPINEVRQLMRASDVHVLTSNFGEGWGAVVNEALEESLFVIGTFEAGSSATMLSRDCLFHAGDWRGLAVLLKACANAKRAGTLRGQGIGEWSVHKVAERLSKIAAEKCHWS